ncbi:protein-L-isoaspartate(D-aspartate) O-methyltransferase [Ilumatobacter fluminis]|uniref:Protein-L-isoaspartate O-methyltransferase n=1 Tax=Ilumatobacter fluminis TaxID=467091 RepID=A0A4R7I0R7_9ACTN|nr:protein-L-isoaspartate(D-aspartate) O-methyltransferase [Ilumatobacter fluminis]TDT16674.1 protein-L-isoaspartate(D-aspartate) O-methyltransferase [Ilumatobacter fluminis]
MSDFEQRRHLMVDRQLVARGVDDVRVIEAMRRVHRHDFVPASLVDRAYDDTPLPIGHDVTISQPYIVGFMTQALELHPGDRVLEVGTGSGYAAAVLAEIADQVVTVESIAPLAEQARERLTACGDRIEVVSGDGSVGHPARAPYDAIVVTAAAPDIPPPLLDQLDHGGRLVLPVGDGVEQLVRVRRTDEGDVHERLLAVCFVPLTGRYGHGGDGHRSGAR